MFFFHFFLQANSFHFLPTPPPPPSKKNLRRLLCRLLFKPTSLVRLSLSPITTLLWLLSTPAVHTLWLSLAGYATLSVGTTPSTAGRWPPTTGRLAPRRRQCRSSSAGWLVSALAVLCYPRLLLRLPCTPCTVEKRGCTGARFSLQMHTPEF